MLSESNSSGGSRSMRCLSSNCVKWCCSSSASGEDKESGFLSRSFSAREVRMVVIKSLMMLIAVFDL